MTDKVCLIVGGGRGMGAATAREMNGRGYKLALMSPSESCEELAAELGGVARRGKAEKELDTYSRIHPTWVCTQALRDRDFKISNNDFWPPFIRKAMADVSFHKLTYKPSW